MKNWIAAAAICLVGLSGVAHADYVQGYTRADGTYVQGHFRSSPDQHRFNNRSSQTMGGTKRDEYSAPPAYNKSSPMYNSYGQQNQKRNQYGY